MALALLGGEGLAQNTPPTISNIPDQTVAAGTTIVGPIQFTVGDAETSPGALARSGTSSNQALVPDSGIAFGGLGSSRTISLLPTSGQTGSTVITVTVTDGGGLPASDSFVLTVGTPNTAPTISNIADQSTSTGVSVGPVSFTVGDSETAAASLILSAASSNTTLVPNANVQFGGSGANRTLLVSPAAAQSGTATITVTVSDGSLSASDTFVLTVIQGNSAPTISNIADQTTAVGTATSQIPFTIGDAETAAGSLIVTGGSSNQGLIPSSNVLIGGSGASRFLVLFPSAGQSGTATITITVSDGVLTGSDTFVLTVGQANTAPTISNISDQTVTNGTTSLGPIAFTVGDAETAAAGLNVTGSSSNPALIPNGNVLIGGSGANRQLILFPASGQTGSSTITITVSDGSLSASDTFLFTVGQANTPPTISNIPDQETKMGVPKGPIDFLISDAQTASADLLVTGTSSNTNLVPSANISFAGSAGIRKLIVTPAAGKSGTSTITVTVRDAGGLTAFDTFVLTVTQVNTPPTISNIPDQQTPAGVSVGPINFSVSDSQTPAAELVVTAESSNQAIVPNANLLFGGSGANRALIVTPLAGKNGFVTITVTVSDGSMTALDNFVLTVGEIPNTAPTISNISDQTTTPGATTSPIAFVVTDGQTPAGSLTVTATSSDTTLVPNSGILLGGSGSERLLFITPAAAMQGAAIITVTVSDGSLSASEPFVLIVGQNTEPTISNITGQTTTPGVATAAIPFTVSDAETPADRLSVTATSSNTSLVPNANILLGGSGGNRTIVVRPVAGLTGNSTITIRVSDGVLFTSDNFLLTVGQPNTAPKISNLANITAIAGQTTQPMAFTVSDAETPAANLILTASSSDTNVIALAGIHLSGTDTNRSLTITPTSGKEGRVVILLVVSDGALSANDTFAVDVTFLNTKPQISEIDDQVTSTGVATSPIDFTVGDAETPVANLTVTATSSNTDLVPTAAVVFGGAGTNRNLVITPAAGKTGEAVITVTVKDNALTASTEFTLKVTPPNAKPTISDIQDLTMQAGTTNSPIPFTVADAETSASSLVVTAKSDNQTVLPDGAIKIAGTGTIRTLTLAPVALSSGVVTVTVSVSDGSLTTSDTFKATVTAPLVAPKITTQPQNFAAALGGTATFTVVATGTLPLNYQWLFNGNPIDNADTATLTLTNVQASALGEYSVIVGNTVGFVFSEAAQLTLRDSMRLSVVALQGGLIQVKITGQAGEKYTLQATENFSTWTTVALLENASGSVTFIDPDSATKRTRFYRAQLRP